MAKHQNTESKKIWLMQFAIGGIKIKVVVCRPFVCLFYAPESFFQMKSYLRGQQCMLLLMESYSGWNKDHQPTALNTRLPFPLPEWFLRGF